MDNDRDIKFDIVIGHHRVLAAILKMADMSKILKRRIAPLMVTYHYVKFYVSIIIHLEVINFNVWNFNFPMSDIIKIWYVGRKWCPELIPDIEQFLPVAVFKMPPQYTKNSTLFDIIKMWYVGR
jgi:hypothetical protein